MAKKEPTINDIPKLLVDLKVAVIGDSKIAMSVNERLLQTMNEFVDTVNSLTKKNTDLEKRISALENKEV